MILCLSNRRNKLLIFVLSSFIESIVSYFIINATVVIYLFNFLFVTAEAGKRKNYRGKRRQSIRAIGASTFL